MLHALLGLAVAAAPDPVHRPELAARASSLAESAVAIARVYELQGRRHEGYKLLDAALAVVAADGQDAGSEARLRLQYARLLRQQLFYQRTGFDAALEHAERARALAETVGDAGLRGDALHEAASIRYSRELWTEKGEYTEVLALHERSLALRRQAGDRRGESESLFAIGLVHERRKQLDAALERYREALRIADQGGFKLEASYAARHLAGLAEERGEIDAALAGFRRSLALREEVGFRVGLPFAHLAVGDQYLAKRELPAAARHYAEALTIAKQLGLDVAVIFSVMSQGDVEAAASRPGPALALYRQALAMAEAIPFEAGISRSKARIEKLASGPPSP